MINAEQMIKAMFILEAARVITGMQGQSLVWFELVSDAVPSATDDDLMIAVRKVATRDTSTGRGSWVTVGDLIAEIRKVRRARFDLEESKTRQVEAGRPAVVSIDIGRIMADTRGGMRPAEVGRRARERAEGGEHLKP